MRCASCERENPAGRRFCADCGAALAVCCAACGASNEPDEKFCGGCGAAMQVSGSGSQVSGPNTQDPNSPWHLAWAEWGAAALCVMLRDYEQAAALAAQALARAETLESPEVAALSRVTLGAARAQLGQASEGLALIRQGMVQRREIGVRVGLTSTLTGLAHAQTCAGAVDDALVTVEQALPANPEERAYRPENLRLRGERRRARGETELAEADFREAIALAQQMGAKMRQLRATMSLARLLDVEGQREEARTMLAAIYGWFTEGFDTLDLKEAKALLEELGETGGRALVVRLLGDQRWTMPHTRSGPSGGRQRSVQCRNK